MDDRRFEIRGHTQVRAGVWDSLLCFSNATRPFCRRTSNYLRYLRIPLQVLLTHSISPHLCGTLEVNLRLTSFFSRTTWGGHGEGGNQGNRRDPTPETCQGEEGIPVPLSARLHDRTYGSRRRGLLCRFTSDRLMPRASPPHVSIYQRPLSSAPFLPFPTPR
jgi:hypothetical protein